MRILMVLTSHDRLGDSGEKTGFWLEEFATPYYVFKDAGATITLASPKGGAPPIDPKSSDPDQMTTSIERFNEDVEAQGALADTAKLSTINPNDYDAIFYPGGHGPLWDLSEDRDSVSLIEAFYAAGKPVGAVCHAPAVLKNAKDSNGQPLVAGKAVTGFSNSEESAVGLSGVVPFLLEDELKKRDGHYTKGDDWQSHHEVDGHLVTGQNPASSEATAKAVLEQLGAA